MSFSISTLGRLNRNYYSTPNYHSQSFKQIRTNFQQEIYHFSYNQLQTKRFNHFTSNPTKKMDPIIEQYLKERSMEIKEKPKDKMLGFDEYVEKYIGGLEEYSKRSSIQRLYKDDAENIRLSYEGYCWAKYNAYKATYESGNPATMT